MNLKNYCEVLEKYLLQSAFLGHGVYQIVITFMLEIARPPTANLLGMKKNLQRKSMWILCSEGVR